MIDRYKQRMIYKILFKYIVYYYEYTKIYVRVSDGSMAENKLGKLQVLMEFTKINDKIVLYPWLIIIVKSTILKILCIFM